MPTSLPNAGFDPKESPQEKSRRVHREWVAKNREHRRRYNRKWAKSHPDSVRATFKKWVERNPEKYALSIKRTMERRRARMSEYKDYMREYAKRYYRKNRLKILAKTKAYAKAHPEVGKKSNRNWRRNHPEKDRAHSAAGHSARKARMRGAQVPKSGINKLIKRWKLQKRFTCYFCGNRFPTSSLHIDHFTPVSRGGKHSPDNVCKSCDKCNLKKRAKPVAEIDFLNQKILPI
jgi:5-methylcytosine-specific restriction endonuclease McrA